MQVACDGKTVSFCRSLLASTVFSMGASPGILASLGGQTKNAGRKDRKLLLMHIAFFLCLDRQWQFQEIQDFAENAWNRALLLTLPRLEHCYY